LPLDGFLPFPFRALVEPLPGFVAGAGCDLPAGALLLATARPPLAGLAAGALAFFVFASFLGVPVTLAVISLGSSGVGE
jgi:hypothetical protein